MPVDNEENTLNTEKSTLGDTNWFKPNINGNHITIIVAIIAIIFSMLLYVSTIRHSNIYADKLDERNKELSEKQNETNERLSILQNETNEKLTNLQLDLNKFQIYKDFSILLADNPNTMAVYLTLESAKETSVDETTKETLNEMLNKVESFANSQIKRHVIDLFNNSNELRADSIAKVLDNLSERNFKSFLDICQTEIDFRDEYGDTKVYSAEYGIVNILHILSCQSDKVIEYENNTKHLNDFLNKNANILLKYNESRYKQLIKILENKS